MPTMAELAAAIVARQELPPEQGDIGPIGPNGKAGLDGSNGRNGDPGPKGATGDRGPIGANGADGRAGADGKDGTNGEPGLIWRGPWVRNLQYWADDAVEQDGSSYVCTVATRSKPPSGAWDLLAKRGATGPPGMSRGGGGGGGGSSSLTVKDEGVVLDAAAASIDFVGAGVTAAAAGHALTITIPGGGGSQTLAQVLVAGNDPDGTAIVAAALDGGSGASFELDPATIGGGGGSAELAAGDGAFDTGGGDVVLTSGGSGGDFNGASFTLRGASTSLGGFIVGTGSGLGFNSGSPSGVQLFGENGLGGVAGLEGLIGGGSGNAGATEGAYIRLLGGDGAAAHGRVQLKTNATDGNAADVLTAQGDGTALWGTVIAALIAGGGQAAFVPDPATPEQIRDSLVAAGIMAAA